ncbi:MAG: class II glutamine amidotransferase [Alphaproteobacteria bacterium]|jgi:glutamine amidotransferase|nr:class II glutamine amidotransferase [Alphaproteobacteria bacterium]MBO6865121.1 class II glutamine amidotransferase [Alphaproteobacteria bacterium]MEC9265832.1 class II glutamine amidotransferase [Pseudomonadota bacterium]
MCRWLAYWGPPLFLEDLVAKPDHSLIHQSLHAAEAKTETNGDGFGLGWYGERPEPGLYREILPAWNDENLKHLSAQIRSRLFFAHVRASTGTATTRANCHPFAYGRWLFMHNGQIGGYGLIRRKLEQMLPDEYYTCRHGTTDSELVFLLALSLGLDADPVGAMGESLAIVRRAMAEAGITDPLRFTAVLSDGNRIFAFRCASDALAPTLYYTGAGSAAMTLVSEPLDTDRPRWTAVPQGHVVSVCGSGRLTTTEFIV